MIMVSHSLDSNTRVGLDISLCLNTNTLVSLIPPHPPLPPESPQILDIKDLKQTDEAPERRRSTSKSLFRATQGQVNSLDP